MARFDDIPSLSRYVRKLEQKNGEELHRAASAWTIASARNRITYELEWLGVPIIQAAEDMMLMQDVIFKTRPDYLIETGVAHGGSLVYYASLFELLGKGEVIGVDVEIRAHNRRVLEAHPMFSRISLIEGSSIARETIEKVAASIAPGSKVMVCLDSNHYKDHVLQELRSYRGFVGKDSYMVVFDTNTSFLAENGAADKSYLDNGPLEAVRSFLEEDDCFEIDKTFNRLWVSFSPDGYLKRIK